jgi:hypothetical protein
MEREGGDTCKGRRGKARPSCRDQEIAIEDSKQVLRPAWLVCATTLPLAGLWVPT